MPLNIKTTTKIDDAAIFIATSILKQLELNKHVLFFATGGSSISVGVRISEILRENKEHGLTKNLTVLLTDERYGPIDHVDSNYSSLIEKGFILPFAKIIPTLTGESREITTEKFNIILGQELKKAEYKIGLFGIGSDGHTAGILPGSVAAHSKDLACGYDTSSFSRITMTFNAIKQLDEAVVWMQGEDKWDMLKNLENDIPARPHDSSGAGGDVIKQPAQILKKVPLLTIFTDFKI